MIIDRLNKECASALQIWLISYTFLLYTNSYKLGDNVNCLVQYLAYRSVKDWDVPDKLIVA